MILLSFLAILNIERIEIKKKREEINMDIILTVFIGIPLLVIGSTLGLSLAIGLLLGVSDLITAIIDSFYDR